MGLNLISHMGAFENVTWCVNLYKIFADVLFASMQLVNVCPDVSVSVVIPLRSFISHPLGFRYVSQDQSSISYKNPLLVEGTI